MSLLDPPETWNDDDLAEALRQASASLKDPAWEPVGNWQFTECAKALAGHRFPSIRAIGVALNGALMTPAHERRAALSDLCSKGLRAINDRPQTVTDTIGLDSGRW